MSPSIRTSIILSGLLILTAPCVRADKNLSKEPDAELSDSDLLSPKTEAKLRASHTIGHLDPSVDVGFSNPNLGWSKEHELLLRRGILNTVDIPLSGLDKAADHMRGQMAGMNVEQRAIFLTYLHHYQEQGGDRDAAVKRSVAQVHASLSPAMPEAAAFLMNPLTLRMMSEQVRSMEQSLRKEIASDPATYGIEPGISNPDFGTIDSRDYSRGNNQDGGVVSDVIVNKDIKSRNVAWSDSIRLTARDPDETVRRIPRSLIERGIEATQDPGLYGLRGWQKSLDGDDEGAMKDFDKAHKGGDRDPGALTAMAQSAFRLQQFDKAAVSAKQALERDPDNKIAEAVYKLSKDNAPEAGDIDPSKLKGQLDDSDAAFLGDGPGRSEKGLRGQRGMLTDAQKESRAYYADAMRAAKVGDHEKALALAEKALEMDPENIDALNIKATMLNKLGRYEEALKTADKALDLAWGDLPALLNRALANNKLGDLEAAKADLLEALKRRPGELSALKLLVMAQAGLGDKAGMLKTLQRAATQHPSMRKAYQEALTLSDDADALMLFAESLMKGDEAPLKPVSKHPNWWLLLLALLAAVVIGVLWGSRFAGKDGEGRLPATAKRTLLGGDGGEAGIIGPYELLGELGEGGMGVVYKARDPGLDRLVAVKKMRPEIKNDPKERARFLAEARTVAKLKHPGIVEIYSIEENDGDVFLVFEYVDGKPLSHALAEKGKISFQEARSVVESVAGPIEYAHGQKVVHRDLKPSNIMLTQEGGLKVMDFGIARQAKDALTRLSQTSAASGTPPYMAPEQEEGKVGRASDVYALGVCLYEMLTGEFPFGGTGMSLYVQKREGRHIPVSRRLGEQWKVLEPVMAKALSPDPDKRYRSVREFAEALKSVPL